MHRLLCFLLSTLGLAAAPALRIETGKVFPTHAVIDLTGYNPAQPCTIEVSRQPDFAFLVPFSDGSSGGSVACAQLGNVAQGDRLQMVLGRIGETRTGSNGRLYGMALKAGILHYVRVVHQGSTLTASFRTADPPYGMTYAPGPLSDKAGGYAYPYLDPASSTAKVVDQHTGVEYGWALAPSDFAESDGGTGVGLPAAGSFGWCSPANVPLNGRNGNLCGMFIAVNGEPGLQIKWFGADGSVINQGSLKMFYDESQQQYQRKTCEGGGNEGPIISAVDPTQIYCWAPATNVGWTDYGDTTIYRLTIGTITPSATPITGQSIYVNTPRVTWHTYQPYDRSMGVLSSEYYRATLPPDGRSASYVDGTSMDFLGCGRYRVGGTYTNGEIRDVCYFLRTPTRGQDSFMVVFAYDPQKVCATDGCVGKAGKGFEGQKGAIIGRAEYGRDGLRWGTGHTSNLPGNDLGSIGLSPRSAVDWAPGAGPYDVTLATSLANDCEGSSTAPCVPCPPRPAGSPIPANRWPGHPANEVVYGGCAEIEVTSSNNNEPVSSLPPNTWLSAGIGDIVAIADGFLMILNRRNQGSRVFWTVVLGIGEGMGSGQFRRVSGAAPGTTLRMFGNQTWLPPEAGRGYSMVHWDVGADPLGTAMLIPPYIEENHYGRSYYGANGDKPIEFGFNEHGWAMIASNYPTDYGKVAVLPDDLKTSFFNTAFAGLRPYNWGQAWNHESHMGGEEVSTGVLDSKLMRGLDVGAYTGDAELNPSVTKIAGTTGMYILSGPGVSLITSAYGTVPLLVHNGWNLFYDASSPNTPLTNTSADNWKYCVVRKSGECYSGAAVGTIVVKADHDVADEYCHSNRLSGVAAFDSLCVTTVIPRMNSVIEILARPDRDGRYSRRLAMPHSLTEISTNSFGVARFTPSGRNILANANLPNGPTIVDVPPRAPLDSVNRSTYRQVPLTLTSVPVGTTGVTVEYGYGPDLKLTSYGRGMWDATGTTKFTTDTRNPIPCATGCKLSVPMLPDRVGWGQIVYWGNSGVISRSPVEVF